MFGIISAVCGFVSGALSTVGSFLCSAATALVTKLPAMIEAAKPIVSAIANIVTGVSALLSLSSADEDMEELGAKTMQEGTRPKGDTESTAEYLDYIRHEVELDRSKFDAMTPEQKMGCSIIGSTMLAKNIEEKVGVQLTPQFMYSVGKANVKPEIVHSMIENFSSKGEISMEPVAQYLSNELSEERNAEIAGVIKESIAQVSPSLTPDEINQEIVDMKRAHNS
jgi:hypothetical protein